MSYCVFEDGRVLSKEFVPPNAIDYIIVDKYPYIENIKGKSGYISGCNLSTGEIIIAYDDLEENYESNEPEPQPTDQDLINAQILLNQAEQDVKLKEIDETLALLLLNQEGGIENVL
jgi:hypothetical protein